MNGGEKMTTYSKQSPMLQILGCYVLTFWILACSNCYINYSSSFSCSQKIRQTNEHDIMFLRDVLVHQPWKHKYGSQELGKVWEKVAESLNGWNSVCELYFKVTQRSVRGWLSYLLTTLKNVSEKKLQQVEFLQRKHTEMLWLTSLNVPRKQIKCIRSK